MSSVNPVQRWGASKALAVLAVFAVMTVVPVSAYADDPEVDPAAADPAAAADAGTDAGAAELADVDVTPFAVPAPGPAQSVINVQVRGDADIANPDVPLPLAGVQLRLHQDNAGTIGAAIGDAWALCTSDDDGDCAFTVPNTGPAGANAGARFWVAHETSPAGWFAVNSLRTGAVPTFNSTPYQFLTPAMVAGSTFTSGTDFMTDPGSTNFTTSTGLWQQSRDNPEVPDICGLQLALVLDLSYSIDATELGLLKEAGVAFVDALEGTPSAVAVYTFASTAPAPGAGNTTLGLTSVATPGGADTVRAKINGLTGQAGYTNWDRAMLQVAQSSDVYDAVVFVTDGNPTAVGDGVLSPNARTRFLEVERGIFSANAVKAEGTRIYGVGILGNDAVVDPAAAPANLQAVTGTAIDDDYFLVDDFDALGENLQGLALAACVSTVNVVKQVIPAGGTIADAAPAAGWTFSATSPVAVSPASATTNASGAVSFSVDLGVEPQAPVTVAETAQAGFELVQQSGANAVCTRLDDGTSVPVTNDGALGFTVETFLTSGVTCQVVNQAVATPAIDLVKSADVTSVDAVGDVVTYTFVATNTGGVELTGVTITDPLPGLSALTCDITEPVTLAPGEALTCTATYTVTQADLDAGQVANTATATGTPPTGDDVTDTDDHVVPAIPPGIAIEKTPSSTHVSPGTAVTFTYTVTNTGAVALSSITVSDDKCSPVSYVSGDTNSDELLDVTETWTFTCTATITQTTTNVATTTGVTPGGETVQASDTAKVTVQTVPVTGGPAWTLSVLLSGLALVAFGAILLMMRGRRLGV